MRNIIWLASYPKSGNTWFRMFISNYQQNTEAHIPLEEIERTGIASSAIDFENEIGINPFEMGIDEIELYMPTLYRSISKNEGIDKPFVFKKIHDAFTYNKEGFQVIPEDISKSVIYFIRNPLDVAVSFANHSSNNSEAVVKQIINETSHIGGVNGGQLRQKLLSWKGHIKSWSTQNSIPLHLVRYEDMLQNPVETFGSIIKFIGLDYNEERLVRAIKHSDFKLLKEMEVKNGFSERLQQSKSFFWKGTVGNYRNYLTEEQIATIVDYSRDVMQEHGYIDSYGELTI